MLIDTHSHIHDEDYPLSVDNVLKNAHQNGVEKIICVGTDVDNSRLAIEFAKSHVKTFASLGVHPHNASMGIEGLQDLIKPENKVIAIGEVGLDYHYNHSSPESQKDLLVKQIEIALKYNLPIIFHVREAFDDFWPIFDSFSGIRGVMHSFTDTSENAQKAIDRGLFIGVNGYATFTKNEDQRILFKNLPLDRVLLETDAPYLTPVPFRGTINESAYVRQVAEYLASLRCESVEEIAEVTTANANALFNF